MAGISQSCWSDLERGKDALVSLRVWVRAADAVGSGLRAYLEARTGTTQPRDAVHLRHQELVASTAARGGWSVKAEQPVAPAGAADLVLTREGETALVEVWNWLADVGEAFRSWDRKLERLRPADPAASGCLGDPRDAPQPAAGGRPSHPLQRAIPRFVCGMDNALENLDAPIPDAAAVLWVSVRGDRLVAARR